MKGLHLNLRAPVLSVVASLIFAAFTMMGCSPSEGEPPGPNTDPGPAMPVTNDSASVPADDSPNCCSCSAVSGQTFADPRLPCQFDIPASWESTVGSDRALVSVVAGPMSCGSTCVNGAPGMSVSYGMKYDSNADTMLSVWPTVMQTVGSARCGEGTVQFFSPPGADATGFIGGVKFYVQVGGRKYSGGATFTCGEPGGWLALRNMFVDSFRDNPGSIFPGE